MHMLLLWLNIRPWVQSYCKAASVLVTEAAGGGWRMEGVAPSASWLLGPSPGCCQ